MKPALRIQIICFIRWRLFWPLWRTLTLPWRIASALESIAQNLNDVTGLRHPHASPSPHKAIHVKTLADVGDNISR